MARTAIPARPLSAIGIDWDTNTYADGFCPGCRKRPDPQCACCGRDTDIVLPAGLHALTLCRRCWRAIQAVKIQAKVERSPTAKVAEKCSVPTRTRKKRKAKAAAAA